MSRRACLPCLFGLTVLAVPLEAVVVPRPSPLDKKAFRHPDLDIPSLERPLRQLGPPASPQALESELLRLGADPSSGLYDWRAGRWGSLLLSRPLVPGDGKGNDRAGAPPATEAQVWTALSGYLLRHRQQLRVDLSELGPPRIGIHEGGNIIHVHAPRVVGGVPVRDSGLSAVVNHGNLILLGLQSWGTLDTTPKPAVTLARAEAAVKAFVRPFAVTGFREDGHLERIPMTRGRSLETVVLGTGYTYRLAWVLSPTIAGDIGSWEALVDGSNGELIAFQDTNQYAVRRVVGGVYPVSNDQRPPDGIEQPGWPMPYADVAGAGTSTTTASGIVTVCERNAISTTLTGPFIRINDACGAVNETSAAGDLDLGFGPKPDATDCVVPAGHSAGDTKGARTGFYELNRIKEQARGYLPGNGWLQGALQSNTNINQTCGAFWNGTTVNFFRSSAVCRNTGEIAGIFDHEWGHGLDDNGVNGNISNPAEAIADIHSILRLNTSCVGRGIFKSMVCAGYGDPCVGTPATGCTGVRDADFAQHASGLPHDIDWVQLSCPGGAGPCGREVHCEGQIAAEVAWDLQFRDLRAAPFNYDSHTALERTTRLMYLGPQVLTSWYTCPQAPPCQAAGTCGCGATGGYLLTLATDDDDGNIANGTPHMSAIRAAFERHQIHCVTPSVINSGCAGGPTAAPAVLAAATPGGVDLTWGPVAGAAQYAVYRTEGVSGCDFGKVKIGETAGTAFSEVGLLDGRTYFYNVLPIGSNNSCFGPMSGCASGVPLVGPDPCVPVELQSFVVE